MVNGGKEMDKGLKAALQEQMETITTHHGQKYADLVKMLMVVNNVHQALGLLRQAALDTDEVEGREKFVDNHFEAAGMALSVLCTNICTLLDVDSLDDIASAMEWSNRLGDYIDNYAEVKH